MDSAYFCGRSGGYLFFRKFFLVFKIWIHLLEVLCLEVDTSVASAGTAETICESIKCVCDVDTRGRVRMGSKSQIFMFFNSGYAHDRNISIFRRRASTVTENTLIKPNYASVRYSRASLHLGTHKVTKKSRRRHALKPLELKSSKNSRRRVFWHTTMPVSLVEID